MHTEDIIHHAFGLCPVTENMEHVEIIEHKLKLSPRAHNECSKSKINYKCSSHKHIAKFCNDCPIVLNEGFNIPNKRDI